MTASGCGAMVKEYGHLLRDDPAYAERAARVSAMTRDLCEVLPAFSQQLLQKTKPEAQRPRVAWHPPCTLQHGQQIRGAVETLLASLGVDVKLCADSQYPDPYRENSDADDSVSSLQWIAIELDGWETHDNLRTVAGLLNILECPFFANQWK